MKFFFLSFSLLLLTSCKHHRSTKNPQDRKYFKETLNELLVTKDGIGNSFSDKELASLTDKIDIPFPVGEPSDSITTQRLMDSSGQQIALYIYGRLLQEFPQFHFLTLTTYSKEGKKLQFTYRFMEDKSIAYYNLTKNKVERAYYDKLPE